MIKGSIISTYNFCRIVLLKFVSFGIRTVITSPKRNHTALGDTSSLHTTDHMDVKAAKPKYELQGMELWLLPRLFMIIT